MHKALAFAFLAIGIIYSLSCSAPADDEDASSTRRDAGTTDTGGGGPDSSSANTCTFNDIYWDSPNACDTDFYCFPAGQPPAFAPTCTPTAQAAGTFYEACGAQGECPEGSLCAGTSAADALCHPFCSATHNQYACPPAGNLAGVCSMGYQGFDTFYLCAVEDDCDPVAQTGCTGTAGCYMLGDAEVCLPDVGTAGLGETCATDLDCAPGTACGQDGCQKLCNVGVDADCPGGTCTDIGHPLYGFCTAAATPDAGSTTEDAAADEDV